MNDRDLHGLRPLHAGELGDADSAELQAALEVGRALDASIDGAPVQPSAGFSSRVMGAIAKEPAPGTVGFIAPIRRRGLLAGFADSVRQAWASIGATGRPSFARATALAYVLVVAVAAVSLAGVATVGVGSALGLFGPVAQSPTPVPLPPPTTLRTPAPETTPVIPSPTPSVEPSHDDDHGGDRTDDPDETDDHGGNSGPGSSDDDHSGPGSGGSADSETPKPTDTPRPSKTPKPSETPH